MSMQWRHPWGLRALAVIAAGVMISSAATLPGCGSAAAVDDIPSTDRLGLRARSFFEPPSGVRLFRVFEVEPDGPGGQLRLVTSHGVVWTTSEGEVVRRTDFAPEQDPLFPVVSLRDGGATVYAGFNPRRNRLVFFDAAGRLVADRACRNCYDLFAADLEGDGRDAAIVRAIDGRSALFFAPGGDAAGTVDVDEYLRDVAAGRLPERTADSLLFYLGDGANSRIVSVRGPAGEDRRWPIEAGQDIAAVSTADGAAIVSVSRNTLIEWDAVTGRVRSRTPVPGSSAFRTIRAAPWRNGSRVVLFDGGGRSFRHLLVVVDATGAVVFQTVGEGNAFALAVPEPEGDSFLVAVEGRVTRYAVN